MRLRLRPWAVAVLVTAALVLLAGSAGAASSLQVSEGGGVGFPARSLVLSVPPTSSLSPSQVHVTENGGPVGEETVTPIQSANLGDFGVVLAIDISPSMNGAAINQALAAARALATQRAGQQELGMVLFDQTPTVKLQLTQDPTAITQSLAATPALGPVARRAPVAGAKARHIYDGVELALQQLSSAHIVAGAVIVLSNGADQGSQTRLAAIAASAAAGHIRIFTVGLRNRFFHPEELTALAHLGGGSFTEADPSQLPHVFTAIETGLTNRYIVHYRSLQGLGRPVQVTVNVDGVPGQWISSYASPAPPPLPLVHRPQASARFWGSTLALVLSSCVAALLVGFGVALLLLPHTRSGGLRARINQFVSPIGALEEEPQAQTGRLLVRLERLFQGRRWWTKFNEELEIARIERPAIEIIALTAAGTVVGAALLVLITGAAVTVVIALILGPLTMRSIVAHRLRRQRRLFSEQLPAHLQEIAAALRTGHSLVGAIKIMVDGSIEPTRGEFQRVLADEELGMPLDEALHPIVRRMRADEIEQLSLVAALHRRSGGNMAEVLDRIAESVREITELRGELRTLTAQARLSRWVVTALPPSIAVIVAILNPGYLKPLFHTSAGVALLVVAFVLVIAGSLVMRALVEIEV